MSRQSAAIAGAVIAGALALAALAGPAAARTPLFWGAGAKTCTDWNNERGLGGRTAAGMRGWVLGMVSGYNVGRAQSGLGDVMDGASTDELWAGIDNFCAAHPDNNIWLGVLVVLQAFDARRPAPPPAGTDQPSDAPPQAPPPSAPGA